jgi:dipeptidyl aminopeptidase/acylaminoacyl peptidase
MSLFGTAAVTVLMTLSAFAPAAGSRAVGPNQVPANLPILFQTDRTGTSDIYAMDALGRRQVPVITGQSNDEDPDWAPDGQSFAFSSDRDDSWQIYVVDATGGQPTQLTEGRFSNVDPVFSPDGSKVAFETNRTDNWEIFVMNADGSEQVNLTRSSGDDLDPSWSSDGRRVVFGRTGPTADLYAVDVATLRTTRLTTTKQAEVEPAASPVSSRIAFSRFEKLDYNLYVLSRPGGQATRLTSGLAYDGDPAWSPDARTIVYTSSLRGGDLELFSIPATGGKPRNLSRSHSANDSEADWRKTTRALRSPAAVDASTSVSTHGPPFVCGASSTAVWGAWTVRSGGLGNDSICGSYRKEWLRGFAGVDKLAGGTHNDRFEGGPGGDLFKSHDGYLDWLYGGQVTWSATYAVTSHTDTSLLDVAYPDKPLDLMYGINKINP